MGMVYIYWFIINITFGQVTQVLCLIIVYWDQFIDDDDDDDGLGLEPSLTVWPLLLKINVDAIIFCYVIKSSWTKPTGNNS